MFVFVLLPHYYCKCKNLEFEKKTKHKQLSGPQIELFFVSCIFYEIHLF